MALTQPERLSMPSHQAAVVSKSRMTTPDLIEIARQVVATAWEEGSPIARDSEAFAPIAVRRWRSAARRGIRLTDSEARVRDLAMGLVEAFDDPATVGPLVEDYRWLARQIHDALDAATED